MKRKFNYYDLVIYAARGSSGARTLATALGCRRWRDDLPTRYTRRVPLFRGNPSPLVVNWGSTVSPDWTGVRTLRNAQFINAPNTVVPAIDKLRFFAQLAKADGVPILEWTTDKNTVKEWMARGHSVLARKVLNGSAGKGISLIQASMADAIPDAPLYTRYFPKTHEYRVHVFQGRAVDFTEKKLAANAAKDGDRVIRSLDNGWVHAHENLSVSSADRLLIEAASIKCIEKLGLDFGAVDVLAILDHGDMRRVAIHKDRTPKIRICEVNTGPGLGNSVTIEAYRKAVLDYHLANRRMRIF